ncbi:hypothetical protein AURDEDRAFT_168093 [Auricularia subglabra TFB-10046 SS5]|nr:hypothetical protein AURDEDRAFT_168093 [Auricularia subglabra TFB-10046 SS5]
MYKRGPGVDESGICSTWSRLCELRLGLALSLDIRSTLDPHGALPALQRVTISVSSDHQDCALSTLVVSQLVNAFTAPRLASVVLHAACAEDLARDGCVELEGLARRIVVT